MRKEQHKAVYDQQKRAGLIPDAVWKARKHRAKVKGLEFLINQEDFSVPEVCPVLGIPLDRRDREHTPSIDRIDNSKGYVPGNVVIVSWRANRIKSDASLEELKRIVAFYTELER